MSDLRKLLNTENQSELQKRTCGFQSTQWGSGWGNVLLDGFTNYYPGYCWTDNCDNSYRQWCPGFCVIPGVTTVQFEIWGGGGSGAGACCCQQGSPGGSGAYAMKTLCASDLGVDTLGGMCYLLFIAPPTCCSACCVGLQGCKSYITGCGLSNFCADGGMPGRTCCYIFHDAHGANLTGTWGPGGTGKSAWNSAGCYTLDPVSGTCYACDCACYYGADFGVAGRPGWFRVDCICGNNCFVRTGLAQPGGFRDKCVRYVIHRNEGNACLNQRNSCVMGEWSGGVQCGNGMRGQGAPSATSCAGGCCYGWRGSAGLIRITYR
jgi:hypothetical protein